MKNRTTKKNVNATNKIVICVPYCAMQNALIFEDPEAYTSGAYGWNADIYRVNADAVIVTGYRAFGNVKPSRELCNEYNKKIIQIFRDSASMPYEEAKEKARALLSEFVEKASHKAGAKSARLTA